MHTLLLQECIPGTNTWNDSANLEDLEESELCRIFGLDPETLQENFGEIFSDILKVFNFFETENTKNIVDNSAQIQNFQDGKTTTTANISDLSNQTTDRQDNTREIPNVKTGEIPNVKTMIRLKVHLYVKLHSSLAFSKNTVKRLPYTFDGHEMVKINYDNKNNFEILTCQEIKIAAFDSVRVKFDFSCHLDQMILFEPRYTGP